MEKKNPVTREYSVTVADTAVAQDAKIHLRGDINGDGVVNVIDKKMVYNHINDSSKMLSGYIYNVGDVNGDGLVNVIDKKMIYNHINGKTLW